MNCPGSSYTLTHDAGNDRLVGRHFQAVARDTFQESTLVTQQAKRTVSVRIGESSRADVQAALGEPWLLSTFWRFDVFRAEDEQTEVDFLVAIWPVPIGVFTMKVGGYVLVAYDPAGRVAQVASGSASRGSLVREDLMLRTDDLTLANEPIDERGLQLFADPACGGEQRP